MKKLIMAIMASGIFMPISSVYANPVNLPSSIRHSTEGTFRDRTAYIRERETFVDERTSIVDLDKTSDRNFWDPDGNPQPELVDLSVVADWVIEREISGDGEVSGQFVMLQASIPVYFGGQWDWYADLGVANLKTESRNSEFDLRPQPAYGLGANYIFYRDPDYHNLSVFFDANLRGAVWGDYSEARTNGTPRTSFTSTDDPHWTEYQGALGIAGQTIASTFYGGLKFSQINVDSGVRVGNTNFRIRDAKTDAVLGFFAGVSIVPSDRWLIDLEGRWRDENAFTGKFTYRF